MNRPAVLASLLAVAVASAIVCVPVLGLMLSAPVVRVVGPPPAALSGARSVVFPSASGTQVHGWWAPPASPASPAAGSVVLLHGVWENRWRMLPRAVFLHDHGFGVLLVDLQAHGESPGRRITFGKLEAFDAEASVAFVRDRVPGGRVGVIGASLGGAASLLGPEPLPVDAMVLESVYGEFDNALGNRLLSHMGPTGPLLAPVVAPALEAVMSPILGVAAAELRPVDAIGRVRAPLLVLGGSLDVGTPEAETRDLFAHAHDPKRLWIVPGAAHVDLERFAPDAYWQLVLPFLRDALEPSKAG